MISVHHLANNKARQSYINTRCCYHDFYYYKLKKGRTELPLPEITCLDTRLLSFVNVVLKSVIVY